MRNGLSLAVSLVALGACSSGESPPTAGSYPLTFPSTAAAVSTDTVQLFVFDVPKGAASTICPSLVQKRRSRQDLPPRLLEGAAVPVCELAAGRRPLTISYGDRALLAVGARGAADYLIGCAVENIGTGDAPVAIDLALLDVATPVPPTACAQLSDFCTQRCQR